MTRWLNLLGWLACVVYATIPAFWLMIHSHADYWRSRKRSPYLTLLPLWIAMWIVLGALTLSWRLAALYASAGMWIPAIVLFSIGLWIYSQSGKHFSRAQLGGLPEILPSHREQRLVTGGIRSRVRHPIYLAHLCEMLAWSLGTGLAVCYGLTAFAMITGAIMVRQEDAELEKRFGEEYKRYRTSVPAILPRVF
jgi:protein-S-isoprenylcysteine O-methyltransferase Ste14